MLLWKTFLWLFFAIETFAPSLRIAFLVSHLLHERMWKEEKLFISLDTSMILWCSVLLSLLLIKKITSRSIYETKKVSPAWPITFARSSFGLLWQHRESLTQHVNWLWMLESRKRIKASPSILINSLLLVDKIIDKRCEGGLCTSARRNCFSFIKRGGGKLCHASRKFSFLFGSSTHPRTYPRSISFARHPSPSQMLHHQHPE